MSVKDLLQEYEGLKWERQRAKDSDKSIGERMGKLEQHILDAMVEIGTKQLKTESGMTVYQESQFYVSVPAEQKAALIEEIRRVDSNGQPVYPDLLPLIETQISTSRLKSVLKEMEGLEGGIPSAIQSLLKISRPIEVRTRGGKNPNLQAEEAD
jgi:hypothetical protein